MKKKLMVMILSLCLSASLFVGCGDEKSDGNSNASDNQNETVNTDNSDEQETADASDNSGEEETPDASGETEFDTSEHVVLTMYCIGDEGGIYADQMLDELNKLLTEKINAEIKPLMVSWGEYTQKLPMVWASGEEYDLTYVSDWSGYFTEAPKGAFMDITELFPKYAPTTYEWMKESGWIDGVLIDGKQYMVPTEVDDYTTFIYTYREDLRKKYDCPEIVDRETLEIYLDAIAENEPEMMPFADNNSDPQQFHELLNELDWARPIEKKEGVLAYDLNDPTHVFNVVDTPEYEAFVKEMREYYQKGYWSQSIMAETARARDLFSSGKAACVLVNFSNANSLYVDAKASNPDWEVRSVSFDINSGMTEYTASTSNGMAVGAYSKNPERALMLIDLIYQDMDAYHTMFYGIEGLTYDKDLETMTKWVPEGVDASQIGGKNMGMGFNKAAFKLGSKEDSLEVKELRDDYAEIGVFPALAGFSIDQESISAELAALASVCTEYKVPLEKGVVDPEEGLAKLREELNKAGLEKVMEEVNRQIEEYVAK